LQLTEGGWISFRHITVQSDGSFGAYGLSSHTWLTGGLRSFSLDGQMFLGCRATFDDVLWDYGTARHGTARHGPCFGILLRFLCYSISGAFWRLCPDSAVCEVLYDCCGWVDEWLLVEITYRVASAGSIVVLSLLAKKKDETVFGG
jgi:hypothetical protein